MCESLAADQLLEAYGERFAQPLGRGVLASVESSAQSLLTDRPSIARRCSKAGESQ